MLLLLLPVEEEEEELVAFGPLLPRGAALDGDEVGVRAGGGALLLWVGCLPRLLLLLSWSSLWWVSVMDASPVAPPSNRRVSSTTDAEDALLVLLLLSVGGAAAPWVASESMVCIHSGSVSSSVGSTSSHARYMAASSDSRSWSRSASMSLLAMVLDTSSTSSAPMS